MTAATFVDEFTVLSTDTVGTTYARTGYGFQPKALILIACRGGATDTVGGQNISFSMGFAAGATQRFCLSTFSLDDGFLESKAKRSQSAASVSETVAASAALSGALDIVSLDADGVEFIVDTQFTVTRRILVFAIGGADITNAFVGSSDIGASVGDEAVTGVGFTPDIVFFLGAALTLSSGAGGISGFGYMTATNQGNICSKSADAESITETRRYSLDIEAISTIAPGTGGTVSQRASFVSMDADGFTVNFLETPGVATHGYLCIKGGSWTGGNVTTLDDTVTDIPIAGLPTAPRGLLAFTHGTTESTQDTAQTQSFLGIGFASSAANRASTGFNDSDGATPTECSTIIEHDELIAFVDLSAIGFLLDVKSVDALGYTLIMDNADDGRNAFVQFVAVGDNASSVTPGNQARRDGHRRWEKRAFP